MQTTAIGMVANSLPKNKVILLTLLISKRYIPYTDLRKIAGIIEVNPIISTFRVLPGEKIPDKTGIYDRKSECQHLFFTVRLAKSLTS